MQEFTQADVEIKSTFYVWTYQSKEIDAFRTQTGVEAAIRRQFKGGWGSDYIFDADGSFQFLGLHTDHSYSVETRDAITGLPLDFKVAR